MRCLGDFPLNNGNSFAMIHVHFSPGFPCELVFYDSITKCHKLRGLKPHTFIES